MKEEADNFAELSELLGRLRDGKITEQEAHDVLEGKLPDGAVIPVFSLEEFLRGVANLPRRYVAVAPRDVSTSVRHLLFNA